MVKTYNHDILYICVSCQLKKKIMTEKILDFIAGYFRPVLNLNNEQIDYLFHELYETQRDGVIELYEFIDLLILLKKKKIDTESRFISRGSHMLPADIVDLVNIAEGVRKGSLEIDIDETIRKEARQMFKRLDINGDGVIDKNEFMRAIETYRKDLSFSEL